jgi:hypothetical protein
MKEDRPPLPRIVERALQFLEVGQDAEPPLRVRVREGFGFYRCGRRWFRLFADREFQESFLRLRGR